MSDPLQQLNQALAGQYCLEAEIGRGGTSVVYRARDLKHQRDVAIKILRPEIASILGAERFLREIRIEEELRHPNILPLLGSGEVGGVPFCVLPLIEGPTLRDRMAAEGPLPVEEAVRIATELARALDHAHQNGIIHRDIKPENVLLRDGHALLTDFGIARAVTAVGGDRLTSEGIVVGTPAYMSPEQSLGGPVDSRTDLYSLGVVCYEMLAGEPPFAGRTPQAITIRHQTEEPSRLQALRPGVPPALAATVHRALAKVPADRFRSAAEMLDALEGRWTPPILVIPARRRRWAAAAGVAVLAVASVLVWRRLNPPTPLDPERVVVFPVPDSSRFNLEVPYAIGLALNHTAPLAWIPGWDWLPEEIRRDPIRLTGPLMRGLTRGRGARYYIAGELTRSRDSTRLYLRLYDAESGSSPHGSGAVSAGSNPGLAALGVEAMSRLLLEWLTPGRHQALVSLAARRPAAVALQVQGEEQYRKGRFEPALDFFLRSIQEDSTWAYAAVKAAQAASWLSRRDEAARLVGQALRHRATLPSHYLDFALGLESYLAGRTDSAEVTFRRVTAAAPRWEEAHMALGDTYYHLLPARPGLQQLARKSFDDALAADSLFSPAVEHRAEIAFIEGDLPLGNLLVRRLDAIQADSQGLHSLGIMSACLNGREGWDQLVRRDLQGTMGAAQRLAAGAQQARCAERVYREILAQPGLSESYAWTALTALHGILIATGRTDQAVKMLDSSLAAGSTAPRFLFWLGSGEVPTFDTRAGTSARFVDSYFGGRLSDASPNTRWALAVWHARHADTATVARLAGLARSEAAAGDRRAMLVARAVDAHLAVARADTALAIDLLRNLRSNAPLDALEGDLFESLAPERILLASLLLATRQYREAYDVATVFDHGELMFGAFVAHSLVIRCAAARGLGDRAGAESCRRRLESLGTAERLGQR